MKKVVAFIMSFAVLLSSVGLVLPAEAAYNTGEVYSQETYAGFELEWMNNGERDLLLAATNEKGTIRFQYDENAYRSVKTSSDGTSTYFTYDNGKLISEQRGTHSFLYSYDTCGDLSTITIDGIVYRCELDDQSVVGLYNSSDELVVYYTYADGYVSGVYGKDENGQLVDKTGDATFVGNLNRVTYKSYYYDIETGWYYQGRFYDATELRFIDGREGALDSFLSQLNNVRTFSLTRASTTVASLGADLYDYCMSDSSFGYTVHYHYSNWYAEINELEITARLIYGESVNDPTDMNAISWVVWNRYASGFGSTLRAVTTTGAFASITGTSSGQTERARSPLSNPTAWDIAVRNACYIYAAYHLGGNNTISGCVTKPAGFNTAR